MKNYEEMTENVFRRRDAYAARQKRNRLVTSFALTAAAACLMGAILLHKGTPTPPPTPILEATAPNQTMQQTQPPTDPIQPDPVIHHLTVLAHTTNVVETQLEENIALPLAYYIGVTDIRDLTSESEINALADQQSDAMDAYLQQHIVSEDILGICHCRVLRRENYLISSLRCGSFQLCLEGIDDIETVNIKTTSGYGEVTVHHGTFDDPSAYSRGFDVTLSKKECVKDRLFIDWLYSKKLLEELESDPTVPLTNYADTITITVTDRNGATQNCSIDITIHDDGSVYALLSYDQAHL